MKKLFKIIFVVITVMGIQATNTYAVKRFRNFHQDTVPCKKNSTEHTEAPSKNLTHDSTQFEYVPTPCPSLSDKTNHVPTPEEVESDFQRDETPTSASISDSRHTQKDSTEDDSPDRSLSEEYSQYYECDESDGESVEISKQVITQAVYFKDIVSTENFKEYFEMKIDNHLCGEIVCKRLLIRPTELFFEKRPVLKKDILQQILSINRTSILHKFKIENSKITNMLNVFDLIVIDSEIKTDKRLLVNPHRWIVKISKKLTQDVYVNKKFLLKKIPIYPNTLDMIVSYSIWCD